MTIQSWLTVAEVYVQSVHSPCHTHNKRDTRSQRIHIFDTTVQNILNKRTRQRDRFLNCP